MRLHVGVLGSNPGWTRLLEQEGVPYSIDVTDISAERLSVLVLSGKVPLTLRSAILDFLHSGGGIVCTGDVFSELSGLPARRVFVKWIVPRHLSLFSAVNAVDMFQSGWITVGANEMETNTGLLCIYAGGFEGGHVVVLPFDPGSVTADVRTKTKSFYAERGRLPFERVALVSKGGVHRLVARSLEYLHHQRGMYYAHKWYYPGEAESIFALRIDTDGASRGVIASLHTFVQKEFGRTNNPVTWFVDVKSQEHWIADYCSTRGEEIGLHCYEHRAYRGYDDAIHDIEKARKVLEAHGVCVKGFAAPYGKWNTGIGRAIDECGFEYSSEFWYDYDNIPSRVPLGGGFLKTTQVPVHPISIGGLRRQGFTTTEMDAYFRRVVDFKRKRREPLIFYHHPNDNHEAVLGGLFHLVESDSIPLMPMGEYVAWWNQRAKTGLEVEFERGILSVKYAGLTESVWLHVTRPDGMEAFTPVQPSIDLQGLVWKGAPVHPQLPADFFRTKNRNFWIPIIRSEDAISRVLYSRHRSNRNN